jgi:5-(carboxyamino)imidazole ribonucleotide mutase
MSIVQMPAGVPVATVAINGAKNAAILASEILALENKRIAAKIKNFKRNLERDVLRRAGTVEQNSYTNLRSKLASASTSTTRSSKLKRTRRT